MKFPRCISSGGGLAIFPHSNLRPHILWRGPYTRRKQPDQIHRPLSPIRGWNIRMSLEGDGPLANATEETSPAYQNKLKVNQSPSASTIQRKVPSGSPKRTEGQPITEQQHNMAERKTHLSLNPELLQLKNPTPPYPARLPWTPSLSHGTSPGTLVPNKALNWKNSF